MSHSNYTKNNLRDAINAYPKEKDIYINCWKAYLTMSKDNHSGMSWNITKNIIDIIYIQIKDFIVSNEILYKNKIIDSVDGYVNKKVVEEKLQGDDITFSIVCFCYKSARNTFVNLIKNLNYSSDFINFVDFIKTYENFLRIINDNPIVPIEDKEENWKLTEFPQSKYYKCYKCTKKLSLFKYVYNDGTVKYLDINRAYVEEINVNEANEFNDTYISKITDIVDLMYPLTFPYIPYNGKFKVEIEKFVYDKENNLNCKLIKSVTNPYGITTYCNIPLKEIVTDVDYDKQKTDYIHINYDEYLELKDNSKH